MMRNLDDLLASQVVDDKKLNKTVELNATISKLKEENDRLKRENERWLDREEEMAEELEERDEALDASEKENEALKDELHHTKVSLDALFKDLEEAKKTIVKLQSEQEKTESPGDSQGKLLALSVTKQSQSKNGSFFSGMGGQGSSAQRKIQDLEKENKELKSELVCLRTQLREEAYQNRKCKEDPSENSITQATECEGSSLSSDEEPEALSPSPRRSVSLMVSPSPGKSSGSIPGLQSGGVPMRRSKAVTSSKVPDLRRIESTPPPHQPQRIGSLRKVPLPREAEAPVRRAQSIWPVSRGESQGSGSQRGPPRRIQSLQPGSSVVIPNTDSEDQDDQRPPLFTRTPSIRKLGWWQ